eukprot:scaffold2380_cov380-Prasinococcus_capsulatus_cf.AAC.1
MLLPPQGPHNRAGAGAKEYSHPCLLSRTIPPLSRAPIAQRAKTHTDSLPRVVAKPRGPPGGAVARAYNRGFSWGSG